MWYNNITLTFLVVSELFTDGEYSALYVVGSCNCKFYVCHLFEWAAGSSKALTFQNN